MKSNTDKLPKHQPGFMSRNMVAIVMVPVIIGLHYGWNSIQNNKTLVKDEERIDLPVVTFAKYLKDKLSGTETSAVPKVSGAKIDNP